VSQSPNSERAVRSGGWSLQTLIGTAAIGVSFAMAEVSLFSELSLDQLTEEYPAQIYPLVKKHCIACHSAEEKEGRLDLERFLTAADVRGDTRTWQNVSRRLRNGEMPPEEGPQPSPDERQRLIDWTESYLLADARKRAGDPGLVLMRRLTKAEYNYTIRELTGEDLRSARKFLKDSVAGEGFANTGEALFMAPDLILMYLDAARDVSAHAVLTPTGIRFSPSSDPHAWTVEAAQRIKDFHAPYVGRNGGLPLADYLEATLRYRQRRPSDNLSLEDFAAQLTRANGRTPSPKYLHILWNALNDPRPVGVMAEVVRQWQESKTVLQDSTTHIEIANSSDPADPGTFRDPPIPGAFDDPAPYGMSNVAGETVDTGFIWSPGSHFVVDHAQSKRISRVRLWSGFGGGVRGATMEISFASAPDGPYQVPAGGTFEYLTSVGGGTLEDGSKSPDTTGWYAYDFEPATARYWRVAMVNATLSHMPRTTTIQIRRVEGVGRFGRGGIVAMGTVRTKHSGALRTSPVLRGTWVVEILLGREIPNPPDDVPQLVEDDVNKDGLTVRQLIERHRADAGCASCHAKLDPYGFALEAYDPIGHLRVQDLNGKPIDARADLKDGESFEELTGLQNHLLQHQDEFTKQFCRKLLGYALGRTVELSDEPLLDEMQSQLKKNEYRFSSAVVTIVRSSQFRRHRGQNDSRETSL